MIRHHCTIGVLCLLAAAMLPILGGCQRKFTHERFHDMVLRGQSKERVKSILGEPDTDFGNVWVWVQGDKDNLVRGRIVFDEDGRVLDKQWTDFSETPSPPPLKENQ